jgi:hypothetical protein
MTMLVIPCPFCIHYANTPALRCQAFPEGIPREVLDGENDHRDPIPGDGGKRYTPEGFDPILPRRLARAQPRE